MFFFCHIVVLPFSKIYCGLHVLYIGLCSLCSWRNVDSQSSLGHFSSKKLFVVHQQLLGQVLCAKIKFSLFTPTKDKHFMECCKQNLSIFISNGNISLFSKLGTHFVPFSLNLLKTFRINKKLFYPLYDEHYYPSILRTLYGDRALFLLLEIEQFKVEYFNGKQKHSSQKPINCWYDRNYD